ncbi:phage holin family protein [Candidatus Gracilibacteria bacterium]|nr:phage holin family protein [Candidatus Gracilibacteria bacterium]NJM90084.1 phage holin family protein [Hydrococcus sp. RU_2_2]NJP21934.1 phage holin family protein [Hydrococcus sp. CRU_1_1]NJQ97812.1 phage holin family protein [Hydrococcus sp. CSU_1_8]
MLNFLLTWLVTAIALLITAYIVPGFEFDNWTTAAIAAIILGLVNAIVRPIFVLLTFPLTILSLGLFLLIINALMLWLVGFLVPGFVVASFLSALIGSIVLAIATTILSQLIRN